MSLPTLPEPTHALHAAAAATTLHAKLGLEFAGIEIDLEYLEEAVTRTRRYPQAGSADGTPALADGSAGVGHPRPVACRCH